MKPGAPTQGEATRLRVPGLEGRVEIVLDGLGVPHIYAENLPDLYLAQGWVTARYRLWQLEITRRTAEGSLAELFGARALPGDQLQRALGLRRMAVAKADLLDPAVAARLDAYARGVNAFLAEAPLPREFQLIGAIPRPWSVVDSLCTVELRSIINASWRADLVQLQVLARLGMASASRCFPLCGMADGQPSYRAPASLDAGLLEQIYALTRSTEDALALLGLHDIDTGSNTWALSGARSESGKPLLANDLHMGYVVPNPNLIVHLVAPGMDVAGMSFPGLPGVTTGHNDRIAWGTTALMADAQDLYLEELDPSGRRVRRGEGWQELRRAVTEIRVRGEDPVLHVAEASDHGPLLLKRGRWALALRTERWDAPPGDPSLFDLNTASDWDSFKAALDNPVMPPTDVSYADVDGNIGARSCGLIPIRRGTDGAMPNLGAEAGHLWWGFLPPEALPETLNPPEGCVIRANQRHLAEDYPHALSRRWHPPYRAERARERILALPRHSVATVESIQRDNTWLHGRFLRDQLRTLLRPDQPSPETHRLLTDWDGALSPDSAAACVFKELSNLLRTRLFAPRMGERLFLDFQRYWPTANVAVELILQERDPHLLPPGVADYDALLRGLLDEALSNVAGWFDSPDPSRWRWGRMCAARFSHTLEGLPGGRGAAYGIAGIDLGSDGECISSSRSVSDYISTQQNVALNAAEGRQAIFGAAARMVWDLGDWDRSHMLLNLGQSGDPTSPHFRDQLDRWIAGGTCHIPYGAAAVRAAARERLLLSGGGADD